MQYLSLRYTDRLDAAGALRSVGSKGDSFDNVAAESLIGLFKTELIRRRGPWKGLDDVELATLEYVDWFNHRRPQPRGSRHNQASTAPGAVDSPALTDRLLTVGGQVFKRQQRNQPDQGQSNLTEPAPSAAEP